jgi:hypothetical protein
MDSPFLPSAIYPRGHCQHYLRCLNYHHSCRYYTVTRVDRVSVGLPLMVGSRGISWGTEWNLAELGQGRGRRSRLHEPTNRPRVPLSYSFYGYEQSSRDDQPWVWCVSEVEIHVLVQGGREVTVHRPIRYHKLIWITYVRLGYMSSGSVCAPPCL